MKILSANSRPSEFYFSNTMGVKNKVYYNIDYLDLNLIISDFKI